MTLVALERSEKEVKKEDQDSLASREEMDEEAWQELQGQLEKKAHKEKLEMRVKQDSTVTEVIKWFCNSLSSEFKL